MTATEIIPHLFIGDAEDAKLFSGVKLCVVESLGCTAEMRSEDRAIHIYCFKDKGHEMIIDERNFKLAAEVIHALRTYHDHGPTDILVHCGQGIERSPLVVAYYLTIHYLYDDIYRAYDHITVRRPQVQRRIEWLTDNIKKEIGV